MEKTHLIVLGKKKETLARKYFENYRKMLELIEQMTILNMDILRRIQALDFNIKLLTVEYV